MKKIFNYENLLFVTIFIIVQISLYNFIENFYNDQKNVLIDKTINSIKIEYNSSRKNLIKLADNTFEGYINRPEIKKAFADRNRELLYNLLKGKYNYLRKLGFDQVHFHTADNKSFLRMHEPDRFGDDLSYSRKTVVYVNRNLEKIHAIETGRVLPGLRNVYPVFLDGTYIGSVDLSFGMEELEKHIKEVYSSYAHFLFNRKEFEETVFEGQQYLFKVSNENPDFVERDYYESNGKESYIRNYKFNNKQIDEINEGIKSNKAFNFELKIESNKNFNIHEHYMIIFIPIHDITAKEKAYFVFYELSNELRNYHDEKFRKHIFLALMVFFVFLTIFLIYKYNKNVSNEREKFESILDNSTDFIHILDENGNVILCSKSFANTLGFTKEEALKLNLKQWNATLEGKSDDYLKKRMSRENTYQTLHRKKDGTVFPVHATAKPMILDGKNCYYVSSRDITTIIKYDELKKQKALFDAVFEGSIDGISLIDVEIRKIISCNQKLVKMLKASSKEEILNSHPASLSPEFQEDGKSSFEAANEMINMAYKEGFNNFRWQHKRFDGEVFWVEISLIYLEVENEKFLYAIWKDIQDKVLDKQNKEKQEAIMMEQSRLAQLGEMVSMIAHQWRQPLNELAIRIQMLPLIFKRNKLDEKYLTTFVEGSKETINYMSDTIDNFRDFYKLNKLKEPFDIKKSIIDTMNLMDGRIKELRVSLEAHLDDDLIVNGYESELKQIIMILINNSLDAIAENKEKVLIIKLYKENEHIIITVKDNGSGIPEEVKSRIFEPYFTTKHSSIGTGIGLYTAKMILERSFNGKLSFESDTKGTIFKIVFPN